MDQQKLLEKIESFKNQISVDIFTFHPVATESDVIFFEQKFGIELPKDMRWFVLNVANGISSVYPTSHIIIPIDFADYYYQEDEYNPAKPFGLTQRTLRWANKEDIDEYPYPTTYDDEGDMYDLIFNGRIDLAGFGCGTVAFIVVNGPEYGNVWIEDLSSNGEVVPYYDLEQNKERLTFEHWMHGQLDHAIKNYKPESKKAKITSTPFIPIEERTGPQFNYTMPPDDPPQSIFNKILLFLGLK